MLSQLRQLRLRHVHQCVDFVFRALEVLDAEGIDGNTLYANLVAHFEDLSRILANLTTPMNKTTIRTLARASNPRLCPSTTSILWFFANRLFPSITKATCCGTGPCRIAAISSSLTLDSAHSAGGDWNSHFRKCDACIGEVMLVLM